MERKAFEGVGDSASLSRLALLARRGGRRNGIEITSMNGMDWQDCSDMLLSVKTETNVCIEL